MSEELKPCPFCGSNQIIEGTETDNTDAIPMTVWFVECAACGTLRSSISNPYRAERRWNTRPVEDTLKAENEQLKSKLKLIKKHVLSNRDTLIFSLKEKHDSAKYSEFAFCQSLLELINAKDINVPTNAPDTNVGNNEVKDE